MASSEDTDTKTDVEETPRVLGLSSWINSHIVSLSIVLIVVGVGMAIVGSFIADTDEPNFSPSGETNSALQPRWINGRWKV
jgi:hypothetical protein